MVDQRVHDLPGLAKAFLPELMFEGVLRVHLNWFGVRGILPSSQVSNHSPHLADSIQGAGFHALKLAIADPGLKGGQT